MSFEDCVKKGLVKKSEKNLQTSKSLVILADIRLENANKLANATLKVESYYEIVKELITALLAAEGYKSYSHECLIDFFTGMQIELIDQLRIMRNDIAYRGSFVEDDFLERNENRILDVIKILKSLLEENE